MEKKDIEETLDYINNIQLTGNSEWEVSSNDLKIVIKVTPKYKIIMSAVRFSIEDIEEMNKRLRG